jgi:Phosphotransferase enzyme family
MSPEEINLPGGKLNDVVRIEDTVRRHAGPWTPTIHSILRHLTASGYPYSPDVLGFDETGREILTHIEGETIGDAYPWPEWVWSESLLVQVGEATAAFHAAVEGFWPPDPVHWQLPPPGLTRTESLRQTESLRRTESFRQTRSICHHDLAPYNVVVQDGRLRGFIDWDLAGPGSHLSEVAFLAWQWVPLWQPDSARGLGWAHPPDISRRLNLLLDSYGLRDRGRFIEAVVARVEDHYEGIERQAATGHPGFMQLVKEGQVQNMRETAIYLRQHADRLQTLIHS